VQRAPFVIAQHGEDLLEVRDVSVLFWSHVFQRSA
jgi:hypothetical protein